MRTGLTRVCVVCQLRVPEGVSACPVCRDESLIPGAEWLARARPVRRDRADREGRLRVWFRWVGWFVSSGFLAGVFVVSMVVTNPEGWDRPLPMLLEIFGLVWFVIAAPLFMVPLAIGDGMGWLALRLARPKRGPGSGGLEVWRGEHDAPDAVAVRGRLRAGSDERLRSPLGGAPCLAFGLSGSLVDGVVDDAGCTALELVTDEGERVRIEPPALLALEPVRVSSASPALAAFLVERGLEAAAALNLREALVVEGDRVEVRGVLLHELDPAAPTDFRQAPTVAILRGSPEAPVRVRPWSG